jgi:hypothetical protein
MKDKTIKNIRICCYVALVFCALWIVVMVNYLIADILGYGPWPKAVDWSQNTAMKIAVLACYLPGAVAMIALSIKMVLNILKGIRENTVFPKSNVKLLFWMAFVDFVYMLGFTNLPNLWDDDVTFTLLHTNFVMPFLLLFFAFMYKVAADAVEENNLTI